MQVHPEISALRDRLAQLDARRVPGSPEIQEAAVALLVRPEDPGLEALLIKRASFEGDPWSGHMALPGGRRDPDDRSRFETARRETREEVGIELDDSQYLGRLDDVKPGSGAPQILVSPFVFEVPPATEPRVNYEVDRALWVPLRDLLAPAAATEYLYLLGNGMHMRFPALAYREHIIWGLTHRILTQFIQIARSIDDARPGGND